MKQVIARNFILLMVQRRYFCCGCVFLCFGVEALFCLHLMYVCTLKLSSDSCLAAFREIAAHSAYDMLP